jgi:hypothetical protein
LITPLITPLRHYDIDADIDIATHYAITIIDYFAIIID